MMVLRRTIFGVAAAGSVLLGWTAMVAAAAFAAAPGTSVAIFAPPGSALAAVAAADGKLIEVGDFIVLARFDDPGFVARLYAAGALLVLDARLAGACTGFAPKDRVASR